MSPRFEPWVAPMISVFGAKGEAIDINHRITKQQYTTLVPLNGILVVERPVVRHANKKVSLEQSLRPLYYSF